MSERAAVMADFLTHARWHKAKREPVPGDASARRYERLSMDGQKAVLMDAPNSGGGASEYAQIAKLADGQMSAFTAIAQTLSERGFSAPNIIAADLPNGLLLLEDLGDDLYARIIQDDPSKERELYLAAVECLAAIYRCTISPEIKTHGTVWSVRDYDEAAMLAEVDLMLEWYLPYRGAVLTESQIDIWHDLWRQAFTHLNAHAPGLVLRDFHAENIFWLPEREANAKVGLIDFQDALMGHPAYDLCSLIEDARRDVSASMTDELISQFCAHAKIKNDEAFSAAYAVSAAQRNAKILGIFIRLAKRDNKPSYLNLLRRVEAHFMHDLSHPLFADLAGWLKGVLK